MQPEGYVITALVAAVVGLASFGLGIFTLDQRVKADRHAHLLQAEALQVQSDVLRQKTESDDRSEWWRRTQWAIDRAASSDSLTQQAGLLMLERLIESPLAEAADRNILRLVTLAILEGLP